MADDIALSVQGLSKDFLLPHERKNSIKETLLHFRKPTYERMHALRDINFEVKRGEFFGIVGRNGSGKSTLLKLIGGIYQPTKGKIEVNGTLTPFIELGIGFNPELTGRENIYLNGAILGLTRKEVEAKYEEVVAFAELERFMDQKLKNYSSGMQVRLAFSIAIQAHNDILLIDEVLAVGDTSFQRKCYRVFREIKNSDKTVIFVTHDMGAVQEFCDRAMMINDSKMVAIGEPRKVALRYEQANNSNAANQANAEHLERPRDPAMHIDKVATVAKGQDTEEFALADSIEIIVEFTVKRSQPIQMNAFFMNAQGEYLADINTYGDLKKFTPPVGKHRMRCTIHPGQLPKGEYDLSVGIHTLDDVPELIDIVDKAYAADTPRIYINEVSQHQAGKFYIQGAWQELAT